MFPKPNLFVQANRILIFRIYYTVCKVITKFTPFFISNADKKVIANFTPYHTYLLTGFVGIYLEQHKILILFGKPKTLSGYYKGQTGNFYLYCHSYINMSNVVKPSQSHSIHFRNINNRKHSYSTNLCLPNYNIVYLYCLSTYN